MNVSVAGLTSRLHVLKLFTCLHLENVLRDIRRGNSRERKNNSPATLNRDTALFSFLAGETQLQNSSWLDVGASDGLVSRQISKILHSDEYECIDVLPKGDRCKKFDGKRLGYPRDKFDFVLFNWVLHHAADDTISLLRDAVCITRKFVIVAEDVKNTDEDSYMVRWHDVNGTFRGSDEWLQLFALLGLDCIKVLKVPRRLPRGGGYRCTRRVFILTPVLPNQAENVQDT